MKYIKSKDELINILSNIPKIKLPVSSTTNNDQNFKYEHVLDNKEINELAQLESDNKELLLVDISLDTLYQFIAMITQLKFSSYITDTNFDEVKENQEDNSSTSSSSSSSSSSTSGFPDTNKIPIEEKLYNNISLKGGNDFGKIIGWLKSRKWIIAEEVIHESPLLAENRMRNDIRILEMEQEPVVEEGTIVCKNRSCKSKRILRAFAQTRSGDEGFTVFFTCTDCGHKF